MSTTEHDIVNVSAVLGGAARLDLVSRNGEPTEGTACERVWGRIRQLPRQFWLTLPLARCESPARSELQIEGTWPTMPALAELAGEIERALEGGLGPRTSLALILFAAFVLHEDGYDGDAIELGYTALELAGHSHQTAGAVVVYALFVGLILPYSGSPDQISGSLAEARKSGNASALLNLNLLGLAFVAGTPLPELVKQLAKAHDGPGGAELKARLSSLRWLVLQKASSVRAAPRYRARPEDFGHWLGQLQIAWHASAGMLANESLRRASETLGPLTPVADRMLFHLYASLTLTSGRVPEDTRALRWHRTALDAWARRCPGYGASMAALANALGHRKRTASLSALRSFEEAAALASTSRQDCVEALAWEQAAQLAQRANLTSALYHYRRLALAAYRRWGAFGCVETLLRTWNDASSGLNAAGSDGAVGEVSVCIAHEIKQPVAAIILHAAAAQKWLARDRPDLERIQASLSMISNAGRQAGDIVRGVLQLAVGCQDERQQVIVDDIVKASLDSLHQLLRRHKVRLDLELRLPSCTIEANRVQLQQVIVNLVMNAVEALHQCAIDERRITVATRLMDRQVEVDVADNGPGISAADRTRVFISRFSTKPGGTGMGLHIVRSIVHAHGGQIKCLPCSPSGTCFRLRLPTCSSLSDCATRARI